MERRLDTAEATIAPGTQPPEATEPQAPAPCEAQVGRPVVSCGRRKACGRRHRVPQAEAERKPGS